MYRVYAKGFKQVQSNPQSVPVYHTAYNDDVSAKRTFRTAGISLPPATLALSTFLLTSLSFSSDISTFAAPEFSSKYLILFVPGIGIISSPCFNTQANASWLLVTPFFFPISTRVSTISRLLAKFLGTLYQFMKRRASSAVRLSIERTSPLSMPRPSGEYATVPTPSSRHIFGKLVPRSFSMSRSQ